MGLVDDFERRLEKLVEGVFSTAFRSDVEPSEIGRRLLREMEGGKSVSVGAVYVPNSYQISLSQPDFARFEGLIPNLTKEFAELLTANARERRWRPAGPIAVSFAENSGQKAGRFEVTGTHEAGEMPEADVPAFTVSLAGSKPLQVWRLDAPEMSIGRSSSANIVINDPNVSRIHANLSLRDQQWWIVDAGSTNGTLVNKRLVKERRLEPGDRVDIGSAELHFEESAADA